MKENSLDFYRRKIDLFDTQFLFFLREKIDVIKNINLASLDKESLQENTYQKINRLNANINYDSIISKQWFLDFLNFDYCLEVCSIRQTLSANFYIPYLQSVNANIYFVLLGRFLLANQIGIFKKTHNLETLDNQRWQIILKDRILQAQDLRISKKLILFLFEKIHQYSLQLQKNHG